MPDGLNNQQRAKFWVRRWSRTFVGKAVVNQDFTFRSVNDQFCRMVGLTRPELLGKSFTDITPEPIRSLDSANADLIIKGKQEHYAMPKIYQPMVNGKKVYVALQVEGIYHEDGTFDCFESEIMELSETEYTAMVEEVIKMHSPSELGLLFQPKRSTLDSLLKYWKILGVVVGVASWILWEVVKLAASEGKSLWTMLRF